MLYPYLEAVGKARIMERSSSPRKRADIKLYRYHYTVSRELPTFPDTFDNQLMPLLNLKIYKVGSLAAFSP